MPWSLSRRDGKVCVIKDSDGSVAGCHDSRAAAVKQMRALYSNESRTAAMYAELDAKMDEVEIIDPVAEVKATNSELVKVVVGNDNEALTASLLERMEQMDVRQSQTQSALVAALQAIGLRESVVNVAAPDVRVEPPAVTVQSPNVTVEAPEVNVEAPAVTVTPDIQVNLPPSHRTVTFERDFDGRIKNAQIEEE